MKFHSLLLTLCLLLSYLSCTLAAAQNNKSPNWQVGASTGPHLPSNLPGVTEILPFSSIRISKGIHSFRPEILLGSARSKGVVWHQSSLTVRNWIDLEGLGLFWNMGFHYIYYQRAPEGQFPFASEWGWNFGFGNVWPLSKHVAFRSDMTLHQRPGRFVQVGLGFQFDIPSGDSGSENRP